MLIWLVGLLVLHVVALAYVAAKQLPKGLLLAKIGIRTPAFWAGDQGENNMGRGKLSIIRGQFKGSSINGQKSRAAGSRSNSRGVSSSRYLDQVFFTRLNTERKERELTLRLLEEAPKKEKQAKSFSTGQLKLPHECFEGAYNRTDPSRSLELYSQLGTAMNSKKILQTFKPEASQLSPHRDQLVRSVSPTSNLKNCKLAKVQLSRGLCKRGKRKVLVNKPSQLTLCPIPELRDEAEEATTTAISEQHLRNPIDSSLICSPYLSEL